MFAKVTLYHYPLSRSVRVSWLMNELAMEFTLVTKNLLQGEGYEEDFLKLNPNHAVPVLVVEDAATGRVMPIFESSALIRLVGDELRDKMPVAAKPVLPPLQKRLLPHVRDGDSPWEVMQFEKWYAFSSVTLDNTLWSIRVLADFRAKEHEKDLLQSYIDKWNNELLPQINELFADDRTFVLKEFGFSLADIVLGHCLFWSRRYKFLKQFDSKLKTYFKSLMERPAFRMSITDAELFENDVVGKLSL